jgi:CRISPR-associated protein Csb1
MSVDITSLSGTSRLLFNVPLEPLQGSRFQPTGFPDLGAATYQAGPAQCLLVESAQSMANRLEQTVWDSGKNRLSDSAAGLSYVYVNDEEGNYLTSSIQEAHRLNSVYIEKSNEGKFHDELKDEIGFDGKRPVDQGKFLKAVLKYDVNSLLHGLFLESIGGRLRIARALSAFIEAEEIAVAASGGVKNDNVQPGTEKGSDQTAKEGYGNVPYHREEYTAEKITSYFKLDLGQIRGYGLGEEVESLLILLSLYKIRAFLDGDLRLRTACDFKVKESAVTAEQGFQLPSLEELKGALSEAIRKCASSFGGESGITTVTWK